MHACVSGHCCIASVLCAWRLPPFVLHPLDLSSVVLFSQFSCAADELLQRTTSAIVVYRIGVSSLGWLLRIVSVPFTQFRFVQPIKGHVFTLLVAR